MVDVPAVYTALAPLAFSDRNPVTHSICWPLSQTAVLLGRGNPHGVCCNGYKADTQMWE